MCRRHKTSTFTRRSCAIGSRSCPMPRSTPSSSRSRGSSAKLPRRAIFEKSLAANFKKKPLGLIASRSSAAFSRSIPLIEPTRISDAVRIEGMISMMLCVPANLTFGHHKKCRAKRRVGPGAPGRHHQSRSVQQI